MKEAKSVMKTIVVMLLLLTGAAAGPPCAGAQALPSFWKSGLADIQEEVDAAERAQVRRIATSPGGRPVYALFYGRANPGRQMANYNSAVGARQPACFRQKEADSPATVFYLGPVHGQEIENIVGLVNLIHVAETGNDHRGEPWPDLKRKVDSCRIIIVPCANPDGRARCPFDSFYDVPTRTMTRWGQGTRKDGSLYGWPGAKAVHPMTGDVGILGAYFNDDGINPMHDDFFFPMAEETRAILALARDEAPDMAISLHSHENAPVILQANYLPWFMKKRIAQLSEKMKKRFESDGLPYGPVQQPRIEDEAHPPRASFNLVSALHHQCGAMAFTFECCHGSVSERSPEPLADHEQILRIQLTLYDEALSYIMENRLIWSLGRTDD